MATIKQERHAALRAPDVGALKSTLRNGVVLDEENVSSGSSNPPSPPSIRIPKPEPESSSENEEIMESTEQSSVGGETAKPKDDLPKMADFLPDIHERIDSLKKPKHAKTKKTEDGKAEGEDGPAHKGPEHDGEIYGENKSCTRPKKVMFGIGKRGVERAVVRFRETPRSKPLHVGFDFPNSSLHHHQIFTIVQQQLLNSLEDARVVGLQYQDRNVLLGTRTMENRWILQVNNIEARDELLRAGVLIFNRKVKIRKYDEMQDEDHSDFVKMLKAQKNIRDLNERPQFDRKNDSSLRK